MFDSLTCLLNFLEMKDTEYEFLKEYCKVLAPLAMAIDKLQGEKECFYGFIIPVLKQAESQLKKMDVEDFQYNRPLVKAALAGLKSRFDYYLTQSLTVKDAMLATVTHPLFKLKPILKEKCQGRKDALVWEAERLSVSTQGIEKESKEETDDYFEWTDDDDGDDENLNQVPAQNKVSIEVLQYLDDTNTSVESLGRYPAVKRVFLKYNTALPSSAPVERLFSFGSIILQGRRGRMTDSHFEKLLLLKAFSASTK